MAPMPLDTAALVLIAITLFAATGTESEEKP
jgi:hypothetical protein